MITMVRILKAHLGDNGSTIASVGVIYGLIIAADHEPNRTNWSDVHLAIRERFQPASDKAWLSQLDRIKAAGWKLHDAVARAQVSA